MKSKLIISILGFFLLSFVVVNNSQSSGFNLTTNSEKDRHNYKHPGQGKKGNCEAGPNAITITNKTNYPIYYDLNPGNNGGKRLVDWRIQPGRYWNHCRPGNMIVEFDYLFAQAGIQAKSFLVKLGQKYKFVKVREGVVDLKKE